MKNMKIIYTCDLDNKLAALIREKQKEFFCCITFKVDDANRWYMNVIKLDGSVSFDDMLVDCKDSLYATMTWIRRWFRDNKDKF